MDPVQTESAFWGVKLATWVAAAAGSAISLSYMKEMTRKQMLISFASGIAAAVYGTPPIMHYLAWPDSLERAVTFMVGLAAMRAIPALLDLVSRLRDIKLPFQG